MDEFLEEIKRDFLSEAADLLLEAEESLLSLENSSGDPQLIDQIFRVAHNLKGTSKAVGFDQIAELTHVAENLILKFKLKNDSISSSSISVLLHYCDFVKKMVSEFKDDLNKIFDITSCKEQIESELRGAYSLDSNTFATGNQESGKVSLEELAMLETLSAGLKEKKSPSQKMEISEISGNQSTQAVQHKEDPNEDIRVKLSKINQVNDYIGELVIFQTVLDQRKSVNIKDEVANNSIAQMSKIFRELQEIAMSLRMMPLKPTFQRMQRIVRDTSRDLNKKVNLHISGEDTEVDKIIVEGLMDPLVHMVRNAIDHGLESVEQRIAAGKSPEGNVELLAFYEGSNLIVMVTDDGGGIHPDRVREKALEKNLISETDAIGDEEMIQLVFAPGFSTKDEVSEVSGRGVGMDVVKTNIESMGGKIKLMSKVGSGSSCRIELPLTLAIIDGVIINQNNSFYALPISHIQEILTVSQNDIKTMTDGGEFISVRGDILPIFSLAQSLGDPVKQKVVETVVVIKDSCYMYAVSIDEICNKQQVVIKQLGEEMQGKKGIIGGTVLGDGKPAFILDLKEMFEGKFIKKDFKALNRNINKAA